MASDQPLRAEYTHGQSLGYAWGENDLALGTGTISEWLRVARENANTAVSRENRAFALGYLRGYREAVRTYARGRWGV